MGLDTAPLIAKQGAVLVEVSSDQPPSRCRPGPGQPRLAARIDGPEPSARGGLAGPLHRTHPRELAGALPAPKVGGPRALALMVLAVGGQVAVAALVEGAG